MTPAYRKIVRYIDDRIMEDITVADVADFAGYSASHVYKIFRAYSPYPVAEYIRRKRMYSAAAEFYTGRKLCDIALDYGYETPAGFYKAFKSAFGCSPREYRNKIERDGTEMKIDNLKTASELAEGLAFYKSLYPGHPIASLADSCGGEKFGRKWWEETFNTYQELFLCATDGDKICAFAFGFSDDGKCVTVHEGALAGYANTGIYEALFAELEKRAKALGFSSVALGVGEGEEEFFAKLGYVGKTLIQSEKYSVDELAAFNERRGNYEITGTNVYEGHINQIWLNSSLLDKDLKYAYENEIGDCWVQVIVSKEITSANSRRIR